jgi:hypothetical protein
MRVLSADMAIESNPEGAAVQAGLFTRMRRSGWHAAGFLPPSPAVSSKSGSGCNAFGMAGSCRQAAGQREQKSGRLLS